MNWLSRALACVFLSVVCSTILIAQTDDYFVNHVAAENWTTTITVYNTEPGDVPFDLYRWDESGTQTVYLGYVVGGENSFTLTSADFGYGGTAMVSVPNLAPVVIKVGYRYQDSHSLCEFFLENANLRTLWMLPNPYQDHFDWFGMALANFNTADNTVTLKAYHNGTLVDTHVENIAPNIKIVDVSAGFWGGVQYADVDLVIIESDLPMPAPLSITGNTEQDRHIFFLAEVETDNCSGYPETTVIPHIAESNWGTRITIYNNQTSDGPLRFSSWNPNGSPNVVDRYMVVPTMGTAILEAGTDFTYGGIASFTTDYCLRGKLSFQYGQTESLCDFFLNSGQLSTRWVIPNSIHEWFDWFGLAVCNPTEEPVVVAMDAFKDGTYLGTASTLLNPHTKTVGIAASFWTDLARDTKEPAQYDDIDMVVLRSDSAIPSPLSITGNTEQDRHVFFLAAVPGGSG